MIRKGPIFFGLISLALLNPALAAPTRIAEDTRPNIIFILSDDQRWDTLSQLPDGRWPMQTVHDELTAKGMTLSNYFFANPICCASRATMLSGKYSHTNGCWANDCYVDFVNQESETVATALKNSGYSTALIGKYMNGYDVVNAPHIPPGWDRWFAFTKHNYYAPQFSDQGVNVKYNSSAYSTDILKDKANDYIRNGAPADKPLFLYFAPKSPHAPADPAPGDDSVFGNLSVFRPPNFNETDVSDKPQWVRSLPKLSAAKQNAVDNFRLDQYETMLATDRAVATILQALADTGRTNNLIIFASDNGLTWGEHRVDREKNVPYEESIRGPFVARWDGVIPAGTTNSNFVLNVDLAPTWMEASTASLSGMEGRSMLPILRATPPGDWRTDFVSEHGGGAPVAPPWCLVRNSQFKYVKYPYTGEEELYDLAADPYELTNKVTNPAYFVTLTFMRTRWSEVCVTPPANPAAFPNGFDLEEDRF